MKEEILQQVHRDTGILIVKYGGYAVNSLPGEDVTFLEMVKRLIAFLETKGITK